MKYIEIDEELYRFIASKTEKIGESASDILRRLLSLPMTDSEASQPVAVTVSQPSLESNYQPNSLPDEPELNATEFQFSQAQLDEQKGAVGRFLFALSSLQQQAPSKFAAVLQVQGRGRLYFARSKEELLQASQSSNPKEIGNSGYWVTTNNNTAKKQAILTEAILALGSSETAAQALANQALPTPVVSESTASK
ncbi:replication initiation negative regulator SeqA [Shewanella sp. C32]|uniref:Negative modulator of initiation of replication n=1 Tax=Shewanella electrica TaxID=515560 RepID=A0ABT2FNN0_9GAMM|nr:replication initiation negative regulator SeqA [Shewanella electrica]MCH1926491.1 replication initiation negative regulator SeqA [Shewanella electrica]MCS4557947.1 replication initiation negative regulator SeqA [Shewanella electrica]